jgi:hypothetical protein
MPREYLGDGLYADYDGYQVALFAPRGAGEHFVALEPAVLQAFFGFVGRRLGLEISVKRPALLTPEAGRDLAKEEPCEQ